MHGVATQVHWVAAQNRPFFCRHCLCEQNVSYAASGKKKTEENKLFSSTFRGHREQDVS